MARRWPLQRWGVGAAFAAAALLLAAAVPMLTGHAAVLPAGTWMGMGGTLVVLVAAGAGIAAATSEQVARYCLGLNGLGMVEAVALPLASLGFPQAEGLATVATALLGATYVAFCQEWTRGAPAPPWKWKTWVWFAGAALLVAGMPWIAAPVMSNLIAAWYLTTVGVGLAAVARGRRQGTRVAGAPHLGILLLGSVLGLVPPALTVTAERLGIGVPAWTLSVEIAVMPVYALVAVLWGRFMGVRIGVSLRRLLYLVSAATAAILYGAVLATLVPLASRGGVAAVPIALLLAATAALAPAWVMLRRAVDRVVFRDDFDYAAVMAQLSGGIGARGDPREMAAFAVSQVAAALGVRGAAAIQQDASGARRLLAGWGSLDRHRPTERDGANPDWLLVPFGAEGQPVAGYLLAAEKLRHGDLRATDRQLVAAVAGVLGVAMEAAALRADLAQKLDTARAQQEEMQLLARRLVEAQEAERRRLARDVHDGPLQSVLAMARGAEVPVAADRLRQAALDTAEELRQLASSLHPALLDDLGPAEALRTYIERLSRVLGANGPVVELEADALPPLPESVREGLFRVAQEALHNALRHGRARHIHIRLASQDSLVVVAVHDDGQGFLMPSRPSRWVASGHLGVASMYERAAMLGGTLQIATAAGAGTTVTLVVPRPSPAGPQHGQGAAPERGGMADDSRAAGG